MDRISSTTILRAVSTQPRLHVCRYLASQRETVTTLHELATHLVDRRRPRGPHFGDAYERMAILLHHNHLPRLDEMSVVEYDTDRRRVRPDTALSVVESRLF